MPASVLTLSCPDRPGIVAAVAAALAGAGANITESQQYGSPTTNLFFMRVQVDGGTDLRTPLSAVAGRFGMTWQLEDAGRPVRTLVLVSREGHCLNDLLYRQRAGTLPVEIRAVVANHTDLRDLADFYGVPFHHVPVTPAGKGDAERRLLELVDVLDVELVVLARYMQVLSAELCDRLAGRAINIHHSFLPSFVGARPYHQAHERGVKFIGATAHYVTSELDEGPIIEQDVTRVTHAHTVEALRAVGRDMESRALATAVRLHAEHRVLLDGHRTVVFQ